MKTTNYHNTFIEVAEDCPVNTGEVPPIKGNNQTAANIQYELISGNPYKHTSDDVIFHVFAVKQDLSVEALTSEREKFFSKGQPCLRSSPLAKRYGWGIHSNVEGKVAIYALGSDEYGKLANDNNLKHHNAMRSKRS
ncbi:MAG: DUF6157 family protein [Balneolales bacterium]